MACRPAFSSLTRTQGVLQAAAFGNCCSKTTHAGATGPVWCFAGVVSLRSFQNRTQGHTGPSLSLPFFLEAFLLRQGCQVLFQLVIRRLLDRADRIEQIAVAHQASLSFYLRGFRVDQSLLFQLSYVLGNCVGAHAGVLADLPDAGPALMGFPILAEYQVGVDRQLARA